MATKASFTPFGWLVCTWVLVSSFQYGYHISALNQIQAVLTCRKTDGTGVLYGLPTCIAMDDATFSVVTASYTVGGLLGSMVANIIMDRWGRKGALRFNAVLVTLGSALMAVSSTVFALLLGRVITGLAAGIGICVVPIFISEIAPATIKGSVGVLTQLAIVFGIIATQAMGLSLATPRQWRTVLLISGLLSLSQFLLSPAITESPVWLASKGLDQDSKATTDRLWGSTPTSHGDAEDPLLEDEVETRSTQSETRSSISAFQALKAPELRKPLFIVSSIMISQQISGINAVLYYSNAILSKALPDMGPYVSLGITVVNVIMTFPPIFLIERMGRRKLLLTSAIGSLASLLLVGFGLNSGLVTLSSVAVLAFVASFAGGLGPVPYVIIPDVSPAYAVSALSTIALSLNWIVNFLVGVMFLPLRNLLAQGDPNKEGRIFYVFALGFFLSLFSFFRVYKG